MPYIKKEDRKKWDTALAEASLTMKDGGCTPGDLNYIVTFLCHSYILRKGLNYTHLNDVVGALESCKAEFQRRVVAPYEDKKIVENGDL